MRCWQFILTQLIFLAGCQPWWGPQVAPAAPPMGMPYPATAAQPVFVPGGQPYLQPGEVLVAPGQPMPQMVPVYPQPAVLPGTVAVPQPGMVAPGGIVGQQFISPTFQPGMPYAPAPDDPALAATPAIAAPRSDRTLWPYV